MLAFMGGFMGNKRLLAFIGLVPFLLMFVGAGLAAAGLVPSARRRFPRLLVRGVELFCLSLILLFVFIDYFPSGRRP